MYASVYVCVCVCCRESNYVSFIQNKCIYEKKKEKRKKTQRRKEKEEKGMEYYSQRGIQRIKKGTIVYTFYYKNKVFVPGDTRVNGKRFELEELTGKEEIL